MDLPPDRQKLWRASRSSGLNGEVADGEAVYEGKTAPVLVNGQQRCPHAVAQGKPGENGAVDGRPDDLEADQPYQSPTPLLDDMHRAVGGLAPAGGCVVRPPQLRRFTMNA